MKKYFLLIVALVAVLGVGAVKAEYSADEIAKFRAAAKQGDAVAQYKLGKAYSDGEGVDKDPRKAVDWFREAAEQGQVDAQAELGHAYMKGDGVRKNRRQAVEWLRKAAEQGHMVAQAALGWAYGNGAGVDKDPRKAFEWSRKAAKQGQADAQYHLGVAYWSGKGAAKDLRQAVEWYRKAAEQGHVDAQANLSGAYWDGRGVIQDYQEGYVWALIAKANGSESIAKWLSQFDVRYTLSASAIRSAQKEARLRLAAFENRAPESESKSNLPNISAAKPPADSTLAEQVFENTWRSVVVIETESAQGSGVIVRPNIVATNCHVVDNTKRIAVYKSVARRADADNVFAASVRHDDERRDFCLLDVDGLWGVPAPVRKYATLKVGESVYGLGAPKGLDLSLSDGLISQLREIDGNRKIQTNVAISPGSSGGGLFDREGNLIGIMTSKITDESVEGIGFAIPADLALRE